MGGRREEATPSREPARRSYASSLRARHAADTRAVVTKAAASLFAARGWAATGVRDVAAEAGVSVETVYSHFGSKADLLMAAVDCAVVGDAAEVTLAERPEFAELARGAPERRAAAAARLMRQVWERTARLHAALREGAAAQGELAQCLATQEQRRRATAEQAAALVAGRPVTAEERDGLWAVSAAEVWQLLTERAGWSAARYERWGQRMVLHLLGIEPGSGGEAPRPATRSRRAR